MATAGSRTIKRGVPEGLWIRCPQCKATIFRKEAEKLGMVPVSQSILADSFPPEKRGQAFALFGIAVVVVAVAVTLKVTVAVLARASGTTDPEKLAMKDPWVRSQLARQKAASRRPPTRCSRSAPDTAGTRQVHEGGGTR